MNDFQRSMEDLAIPQAKRQRQKRAYAILDEYSIGNHQAVIDWLEKSDFSLGELLEIYIPRYNADLNDAVNFVKALERKDND